MNKITIRKVIKIYLLFSIFLWIGTIVGAVASGALYHNNILMGVIILGFFMCLFTLGLGVSMTYSGLDNVWFKTVEELKETIAKDRESWKMAEEAGKIIGNHEALKLWKARKENQRYYKGNQYTIWGPCKMKNPVTRDWVDAIIYKRTDGEGGYYIREESEFKSRFITAPSEVG